MESFRLAALRQIAKSAGILTDKVKQQMDQNTSSQKFNYSNANISLNVSGASVIWPGPQCIHADGSVNFLFFFRGGSSGILSQSGTNAVVITADAGGGGGGPSGQAYGNANFINSSVQSILKQLEEKTKIQNLHVGKLGLAGWSGGYDPIFRILKQKSQLIHPLDYVGVFDGMHHGSAGKPDEKAMETWKQEAEEAANGGTQFVVTHTAVKPPYASSTDTSNYLLNQLGMQRQPVTEWKGTGRKPDTIAQKGNFEVIQLFTDKSEEPNEGKQHLAARDFSSNVLPHWE